MTEEGYRGEGQPAACPLAQYHSFPQYYLILAQSSICLRISKSVCEDLPCFLHTGLCPSWWNVWWRPKVNLSSMILLSIGSCKPAREGWSRNTASRSRETPRGQKRRSSHQLCYLHFFSQSLAWVCSPQLAAWLRKALWLLVRWPLQNPAKGARTNPLLQTMHCPHFALTHSQSLHNAQCKVHCAQSALLDLLPRSGWLAMQCTAGGEGASALLHLIAA